MQGNAEMQYSLNYNVQKVTVTTLVLLVTFDFC